MTHVSASALSVAVPACATIIVAVLAALAAYLAAKREQRRSLYSEAVKAAVVWEEMLYRVRRRGEGAERDLIERFHELQDNLTFYNAWVGSESKYMSRSYKKLTKGVKDATEGPIKVAWKEPPRAIPGEAVDGDTHPDIDRHVEAFLADVRSHLSPLPWRKLAVVWRNRKTNGS
jgi:hypothetical protein